MFGVGPVRTDSPDLYNTAIAPIPRKRVLQKTQQLPCKIVQIKSLK
jgi:hypothetical protein